MQSTRIEAQELLARLSRRRRLYRRLMCVFSAAVALITFAMLTFPGVTMERTAVCSAQPHTHEDSCYQQNLICGEQERPASPETVRVLRCTWQPHRHTDDCRDANGDIACGYTADYWHEHAAACYRDGSLVCPLAHRERHEHTADCYEQQRTLLCTLEETTHTGACYALVCGQEEQPGHLHTQDCFEEQSVLACTLSAQAHTHGEDCFVQQLLCAQAETDGHEHGDACYQPHAELICAMDEGEGAHAHGEGCYTAETVLACGMAEGEGAHAHHDGCYHTQQRLTCSTPEGEGAHSHSDSCLDETGALACGLEESAGHAHGADCYSQERSLVCGAEESAGHSHTDGCYTQTIRLCCSMEESAGHVHGEGCFATVHLLACTQQELPAHHHGEGCYETICACGLEETQGHEHGEACYAVQSTAVCGLAEGEGAHSHTDECFALACTQTHHSHSEACWQQESVLACGWPEEHVHTGECFDADGHALCALTEMAEHVHGSGCFADAPADEGHTHTEGCWETVLICQLPQHEHSEACYPEETEPTVTPEPTATPELTATPEATATPEPTAEPEPTATPEASAEPELPLEPEAPTEPEAPIEPEAPLEPECGAAADPQADPEAGLDPNGLAEDAQLAQPEPEGTAAPEPTAAPETEETQQPVYCCGLEEHQHIAPDAAYALSLLSLLKGEEHELLCYDAQGNLICPLPEHTHGESCLMLVSEPVAKAVSPTDIGGLVGTYVEASQVKYDASNDRFEMSMNMGFAIWPQDIADHGYEYYLDLPNDLNLPGELIGLDKSFSGYDKDGQLGFTYQFTQISGHLRLLIHFLPEYVDQYVGPNNKPVEGYVAYRAYADQISENGDLQFAFGDSLTLNIPARDIEYPSDETSTSDLSLSKSGSYQTDWNKLVYTVTVRSMKGTPADVALSDVLTHPSLTVQSVRLTSVQLGEVTEYGGAVNFKAQSIPDVQSQIGSGQTSVSLTLPRMPEPSGGRGYEYRLTFEYTLEELPQNASFRPSNTVTASSRTSGDRVEDSASAQVSISTVPQQPDIAKTGSYSSANGTITWKITLNTKQVDIAGWGLSDEMLKDAANLTISPSGGYTRQQDGSIRFSAVSGGRNTQSYTITYRTEAPGQGWSASAPIRNTAVLDPTPDNLSDNTGVPTGSANVTIPGYGSAQKTHTGSRREGETDVLGWQLTIHTPGKIAKGTEMTDALGQQYSDNAKTHYFTQTQALALAQKLTDAFGGALTMSDIQFQSHSDGGWHAALGLAHGHYGQMRITFSSDYAPKGNGVTIEYESTAATSGLSGAATFTNSFTGAPNTPSWTYKPPVVKTNASGQTGASGIEDADGRGEIVWKVKVYLSANTNDVEIIDTLPEGVALTGLSFGASGTENEVTIAQDGALSGQDNGLKASGSASGRTVALRLTLNNGIGRPGYFGQGREFWIVYTCAYDLAQHVPAEGQAPVALANSVTVNVDGASYGSSSQTQTVTVGRPKVEIKQITKGGSWDNDKRIVSYSVDLNPEGKDLIYGSDTLTVVDTLSYWFSGWGGTSRLALLNPSSVRLFQAQTDESGRALLDENERLVKGEPLTNGWNWSYDEAQNQYNPINEHILTISIPDNTPLILEYQYSIQMEIGDPNDNGLDLQNTCALHGNSQETALNNCADEWHTSSTSAGVTSGLSYIFYKVDASDYAVRLSGAEFTLFEWENGAWHNTGHKYISDDDGKITVHWQRSANAMLLADDPTLVDYTFTRNKGYYLVETKAPQGYVMPEKPPRFYFYFASSNTYDYPVCYPDDFTSQSGLINLEERSATVFCENTSNLTAVSVEKVWKKGTQTVSAGPSVDIALKRYAISNETESSYENAGASMPDLVDFSFLFKAYDTQLGKQNYQALKGSKWRFTVIYDPYIFAQNQGNAANAALARDNVSIPASRVTKNTAEFMVTIDSACSIVLDARWWNTPYISYKVEQLSSDAEFASSATLNSANGWQHQWADLPVQNSSGQWYLYYVDEPSVPEGYTVSYAGGMDDVSGRYFYTVTNTRQATQATELSVFKEWNHADGTPLTASETADKQARIQLYQQLAGSDTAAALGEEITLDASNNFTHTWFNLPQSSNDVPFTYYVRETSSPPGFRVSYGSGFEDPAQSVSGAEGTLLVTNTEKEISYGSIGLRKRWHNTPQSAIRQNGEIPVTLRRWAIPAQEAEEWLNEHGLLLAGADASGLDAYIDEGYASRHTLAGDGTELKVDRLPLSGVRDGAEVRYGYFAQEDLSALSGSFLCETEESADGSPVITLTNTMQGMPLVITKHWRNADGTPMTDPPAHTLYFALYQNGTAINPAPYVSDWAQLDEIGGATCLKISGFQSGVHSGTVSLYGLPETDEAGQPYVYTVEEIACILRGSAEISTDLSLMEWAPAIEKTDGGFTVVNAPVVNVEYVLPETGGQGTRTHTLAGLMLIAAAAGMLMMKKREKEGSGQVASDSR